MTLSKKTAVKEIILWVGAIITFTVVFIGLCFYIYTTRSMVNNLNKTAVTTLDEISSVLVYPLYTLDDNTAVSIAGVYLLSDKLSGIKLVSSASGVLLDKNTHTASIIPKAERDLFYNGMNLGKVTITMDDSEIKSAQKRTLIIVFATTLGVAVMLILSLSTIFRRVLINPMKKIHQGIKSFGSGDFNKKIDPTGYSDLDLLTNQLNLMADNIRIGQKQLINSEKRYSLIFNSSFLGIFLCTPDGTVADVNETAVVMFNGEEKHNLLGTKINRFILISDDEMNRASAENMSNLSCQARYFTGNRTFYVDVAFRNMVLDSKNYLLINVIDTTARKMAEEGLIQAQKMEVVGTLAGGLAHDFNNIIGIISSSVSFIELKRTRGSLSDDDIRKYMNMISETSAKAAKLIQQLLTVAKRTPLNMTGINITSLVKNCVDISLGSLDKSIEIEFEDFSEDVLINADASKIEQVLINLIINAGHAMTLMRSEDEQWGGTLSVTVSRKQVNMHAVPDDPKIPKGEYCVIQISDTGVGMSPEHVSRLFEPFFTTKKDKGTGLGLTMVKNIITSHGGYIKVYSEENTGSSFFIYLPTADTAPNESQPRRQTIEKRLTGTVLIVDDETHIREMAKDMCVYFGLDVLDADCGEAALRLFREKQAEIDIVLLDLIMPGKSGYEVLKILKDINPYVRVVMSSGFRYDPRIDHSLSSGADGFIGKPYSVEELYEVLNLTLS